MPNHSHCPTTPASQRIDVLTLFPEMFAALDSGITGRAACRRAMQLHLWNPRNYSQDAGGRVDDHPYGGGPGMLMQIQPLEDTLQAVRQAAVASQSAPATASVIYLTPCGQPLTQKTVCQLARQPHLVLIAGRYRGIDQRFIDQHVDACYAIGDFVVSGGELPAMMLIDAMCRQQPQVLGNPASAADDSFMQGLLEAPQYTRPAQHSLGTVPAVLRSGDHQAIKQWQRQQSLLRTWQQRPDMLKNMVLSDEQARILDAAGAELTSQE